jgi:hypothetical protein
MNRLLGCLVLGFAVTFLAPGFLENRACGEEESWAKARGTFLKVWGAARKTEERMHAIYDHLEGHDRPEVVPVLVTVIRRDDLRASVIEAAIAVLGDLRSDAAIAALVEASKRGTDLARARALQALGRTGTTMALKRLGEALNDGNPLVRIAAAAGLGGGKANSVPYVPELGATLKDECWPVRAAAMESLGKLESEGAVPHLIAALGREGGRLREDAALALRKLTNARYGISFDAWKQWWEKKGFELEYERSTIVPDPERPTVVYHGIETWAHRVVFVFDVSMSMREEVRVDMQTAIPKAIRDAGGEELDRWQAMKTRIEWARAHLIHAIETMAPETRFGIVTYNDGFTPVFSGKLVEATEANKRKAITRVAALSPSGETNLYGALMRALAIPAKGVLGTNLVEGPGTIYFMTDGVSTSGEIEDSHRIAEEIRGLNTWRRIRFHCVGIGNEHDSSLMSALAGASAGSYKTLD